MREAVERGKFNIYPVDEIDQGIELLTGLTAGIADQAGSYPPDTINGKVQQRLERLAKKSSKREPDEVEDET